MSFDHPHGVILAGGKSSRMGGLNKALVPLAGRPLVQHVIDRMVPQTRSLVFSVDSDRAELDCFGLAQVRDPQAGSQGPLGGLLAALQAMPPGAEWLLLVPCDAPFLPLDLASRLTQCARNSDLPGCAVRYRDELQPTFSLWHRQLVPLLSTAVLEDGLRGFKQYLRRRPLAVLDWDNEPREGPEQHLQPFFNINSPADLEQAETLLAGASGPIS